MLKYGKNIMERETAMSIKEFCLSIENEFRKKTAKARERLVSYSDCNIFNEAYGKTDGKIYVKSAVGDRLEDYDGNEYIDLAMGGGTFIIGHSSPMVIDQMREQLNRGSLYTTPNFITYDFGKLLSKTIRNMNSFVFCNSGSEATMRAVRIARAFTKKRKIGIFSGGWHGSHDMVLVDEDYSDKVENSRTVAKSSGVPKEMLELAIVLPYNHEAAFEIIKKHRDELAVVLVEPAQGSNPRDDMGAFLKGLRSVTRENDILLCFDEIITGFRVALGGAQEYYGIHADMATYGKTIGGGLPIGVVAGKEDIMNTIKNGTSLNPQPIFMGGTFSANPLAMVAGLTTLSYLIDHRNDVYSYLNRSASYLKSEVNSFCEIQGIPARIYGFNSMMRLIFTDKPIRSRRERDKLEIDMQRQNIFYTAMLNSGIHIAGNRLNFLSTAHTEEDIKKILLTYTSILNNFSKVGFFNE